ISFQLSAQAITAQTAITRMSVRGCSTLRRRGSATAPKCPTSRSIAMICSPLSRREDHLPPGNLLAIGFSCVTPAATPDPKWVVAAGDCALDGGIFKESYAVVGGVSTVVP